MNERNGWQVDIQYPLAGRLKKPRESGLTMVLDKGLGVNALKDLLEISSDYLDFLKFSFGSSLLYPVHILKEKIKLARTYKIDIYPGGTLFEIALSQNKSNDFLLRARQLGFTAIEISNGTLNFSQEIRDETINKAKSLGFKVLTEVGKKDKNNPLGLAELKVQIEQDILSGADKIIVEGRESGRGIGIYYDDGSIDSGMVEEILMITRSNPDILIWEAPLKSQQVILIKNIGPNVNLGNIAVDEVLALESLRQGIRGDTFNSNFDDTGCQGKRENNVSA